MSRSRSRAIAIALAVTTLASATGPAGTADAAPIPNLKPTLLSETSVSDISGTPVVLDLDLETKKKNRWTRYYNEGYRMRYAIMVNWSNRKKKPKPPTTAPDIPGGIPGGMPPGAGRECEWIERTKTQVTNICVIPDMFVSTTATYFRKRGVSLGVTSFVFLLDYTTGEKIPFTEEKRRDEIADVQALRAAQLEAVCAVDGVTC